MVKQRICAWDGCDAVGEFPAPIDPRDLRKRQYFCAEHIKQFNKQWNGLAGMSPHEINELQDADGTWGRPTRPFAASVDERIRQQMNFDSAQDLFEFFKQRKASQQTSTDDAKTASNARKMPPDVRDACLLFGLETPPAQTELKQLYHGLLKQHHPDVNAGDATAEARAKELNIAYQILNDWVGTNHVGA